MADGSTPERAPCGLSRCEGCDLCDQRRAKTFHEEAAHILGQAVSREEPHPYCDHESTALKFKDFVRVAKAMAIFFAPDVARAIELAEARGFVQGCAAGYERGYLDATMAEDSRMWEPAPDVQRALGWASRKVARVKAEAWERALW